MIKLKILALTTTYNGVDVALIYGCDQEWLYRNIISW